jgi:bacterioferritin-associated ferredoxin
VLYSEILALINRPEEEQVMKRLLMGLLLVIPLLASYKSSAEAEQGAAELTTTASTDNVEADKEPNAQQATDEEIKEVIQETEFTSKQLTKAVKGLGYRCSMVARTGTRVKKKVCTTKQQREVLAEAAKQYLRDVRRHTPVKNNKRGN